MERINRKELSLKVETNSKTYYFSEQQIGIDNRIKKLVMEQILPYLKGHKVLELGFVDGMFTDVMLSRGFDITIVEGAEKHVNYAKNKYKDEKNVSIIHDYFELFDTQDKYNTVLAGDMIQFLDDAVAFFSRAKNWLADDGILIVTTPNRRSFHRRIGTYLNVLSSPEEVNINDKKTGNVIMYDMYQLNDVLLRSGLCVHFIRGCFFKPLSSSQMKDWDDELLRAFLKIGEELGDYCWFLVACCSR